MRGFFIRARAPLNLLRLGTLIVPLPCIFLNSLAHNNTKIIRPTVSNEFISKASKNDCSEVQAKSYNCFTNPIN